MTLLREAAEVLPVLFAPRRGAPGAQALAHRRRRAPAPDLLSEPSLLGERDEVVGADRKLAVVPSALLLSRIRATRADPPVLAVGDEGRRRVYTAALQQFEELLGAAGQVSAWARPLPLFYALSQVGRAIAAARATNQWRLSGHGLKLLPKSDEAPLLERQVKPEPRQRNDRCDAFGGVADCTGSAPLRGPVEVGGLWASLPEAADLPDLRWARARWVEEPAPYGDEGLALAAHRGLAGREAAIVFEAPIADHDGLAAALQQYPTARPWQPPRITGLGLQVHPTRHGRGYVVRYPERATGPEVTMPLDELAPQYRRLDARWLRPMLGESGDLLSPLMTWWALLYALSIVARYEPDAWATTLNVDASPLAVPLERLLDEALGTIPHLVLEALLGHPVLLGAADEA